MPASSGPATSSAGAGNANCTTAPSRGTWLGHYDGIGVANGLFFPVFTAGTDRGEMWGAVLRYLP